MYNKLKNDIISICCDELTCGFSHPTKKCEQRNCAVIGVLNTIDLLNPVITQVDEGCSYCFDKHKREREIFYFDTANNMRTCKFCPECGRKYHN